MVWVRGADGVLLRNGKPLAGTELVRDTARLVAASQPVRRPTNAMLPDGVSRARASSAEWSRIVAEAERIRREQAIATARAIERQRAAERAKSKGIPLNLPGANFLEDWDSSEGFTPFPMRPSASPGLRPDGVPSRRAPGAPIVGPPNIFDDMLFGTETGQEDATLPGTPAYIAAQEAARRGANHAKQAKKNIAKGDATAPNLHILSESERTSVHNNIIVTEYLRKLADWEDDKNSRAEELPLPGLGGEDGNLGTAPAASRRDTFYNVLQWNGPPFLLIRGDNGKLTIEDNSRAFQLTVSRLVRDPAYANDMQVLLSASGLYKGGNERYVQYRRGLWSRDDTEALQAAFAEAAMVQRDLIAQVRAGTLPSSELKDVEEIIADRAVQGAGLANAGMVTSSGGGGGGGGGFGRGGGGGGVSQTDPAQLRQLINGIARARLGRVLTDDEAAMFIADFHTREKAYVHARIAGQDAMQLDPESQAAQWIEQHFATQQAGELGGRYVQSFAQLIFGEGGFGS